MVKFSTEVVLSIKSAGALEASYQKAKPVDFRLEGTVAVIEVHGPIEHHVGDFVSYDGIKAAYARALASTASCVLLSVDSPGGIASGCTDTAQELRAMAQAAGKPLYAYIDGEACSAAYLGLVCAADRVYIPATGSAGSLGVIQKRVDVSKAIESGGVNVQYITSGSTKAYGKEELPITSEEMAHTQGKIDQLAGIMLGVAASFRGKKAEDFAALDAEIFIGQDAITAGLADEIATYDQVIAAISVGSVGGSAAEGSVSMAYDKEEAIAALRAAAEEGDEQAKAMIAAMDGEEDKDEEGPPEEKKAEGEEEKKEESKAMAAIAAIRAELAESARVSAVSSLLAARGDLSPELRKTLASKPVKDVSELLSAIPQAQAHSTVADSIAAVKAGQSPNQGGEAKPQISARAAAAIGGDALKLGIFKKGNSVSFGFGGSK